SHTTTAMTNARLDNYVYTAESIERARNLLNPGGVLTLSFCAERHYISHQLYLAITRAFGHDPLAFFVPQTGFGGGHLMYAASDRGGGIAERVPPAPRLASHVEAWLAKQPLDFPRTAPPATDDWPYLYLEK